MARSPTLHPPSAKSREKEFPYIYLQQYLEQKFILERKFWLFSYWLKLGHIPKPEPIILARKLDTFIGLGHLLVVEAKMVSTSPKPTQNEQLEWDNLPEEDEATIFRRRGNVFRVTKQTNKKQTPQMSTPRTLIRYIPKWVVCVHFISKKQKNMRHLCNWAKLIKRGARNS